MRPLILFRPSLETEQEFKEASLVFKTVRNRSAIPDCSIVFGRYSVLPFYEELEIDLKVNNSKLINSYYQHSWIADFKYYDLLKEYTFPTYFDYNFHEAPQGVYIVKGRTNSRKQEWDTKMFAKNKLDASLIASELANDSLIGSQGILYRKYIPLETYEIGINGLPFTNEWRFFFFRNYRVGYSYYWSTAEDINKTIDQSGRDFAHKIARLVSPYVNFFVVDIAKTVSGDWILVELNDAQMSGLSLINPSDFYSSLDSIVKDSYYNEVIAS